MAMTLAALKVDLEAYDSRDDEALQVQLDAAIAFAKRVRADLNWDGESSSELPDPSADHELGVIRLAGRWHTRRRSPDGLVASNELGNSRVPSVDPDIERLLGIGRYHAPVIA